MIILNKKNTIFIHNHRTGGTSFANILRLSNIDITELGEQHNCYVKREDVFHAYPGHNIIGFVRNPWDRLVSWYLLVNQCKQRKHVDKSGFETFLHELIDSVDVERKIFNLNQLDYFTDDNNPCRKLKIGRFENFEDDTCKILASIGITVDNIPHLNETYPFDYRDFYNKTSRELIERYCREDIEEFGYLY